MYGSPRSTTVSNYGSSPIGFEPSASLRTVDIYRTRLLRKYGVSNTAALIPLLIQG